MIAALIENGIVANMICANAEWAAEHLGGTWVQVKNTNYPGIGWTWNGKKFVQPVEILDGETSETN